MFTAAGGGELPEGDAAAEGEPREPAARQRGEGAWGGGGGEGGNSPQS